MSKLHRIVVEVAVPPLLAVFLLVVIHPGSNSIQDILIGFPAFVVIAYAFGILPCLGYAAAMEFWFAKGLQERCGRICTVGLSTMIGFVAGYVVQTLVVGGAMILVSIGGLVGLIVGLYLACRYCSSAM